MTVKEEITMEYRIDTGNPNYSDTREDIWFRVYSRNGKLLQSFRNKLEAEKFIKENTRRGK